MASPHERAWREALEGFADPARFTTEFYQAHVAGKPRMDGARATLEGLGVPDAAATRRRVREEKQALIDRLIDEGSFEAFPDAVRLAAAFDAAGLRLALASSSKNVGRHAAPPEPARRAHAVVDLRCGPQRHATCRAASRILRYSCWRRRR